MKRLAFVGAAVVLGAWSVSQALDRSGSRDAPGTPARPVLLGPVRGDLGLGLAQLESRAARCASERDPAAATAAGETLLSLEIETIDGGLRIADALPGSERGDARAADCAREALQGQIIPSRLARAGTRFQMPFRVRAPAG
jgi:hypothetical protein